MRKSIWDKAAEKQFKDMPKNFQKDWKELRDIVHGD